MHTLAFWSFDWFRQIHDRPTFHMVIAIAVAQAIAAWYGGYLSALSLDAAKQKTFHIIAFATLGFLLVVFTIRIGVLNDQSQYESSQRASTISGQLTDSKVALLGVSSRFLFLQGAVSQSKCPNMASLAPIIGRMNQMDGSIAQILSATAVQFPPKPPPSKEEVIQLHFAILRNIADLHEEDNSVSKSIRDDKDDWGRLPNLRGDPNYLVQQIVPRVARMDQRRRADYEERIRPQILKTVLQAQNHLRMSPEQTQIDDAAFFKADSDAMAIDPPPEPTWTGKAYEPQFTGMITYLNSLDDRVWKPQ
jgi:hypothetical protein